MHTHLYKAGGAWKTEDGVEFTIKAFDRLGGRAAIKSGDWYKSLEDALAIEAEFSKEDDEHEKELRGKIKLLGGSPAGRSSIKTLEAQLKGLEDGDNNEG